MKLKFSVIVPTKNEEKNIEKCLKSIRAQIYPNLEIIVVDNHSTDKTPQLAKKYTAKVFQKGPERSSQRNFGVQKASGSFLFFVDADMTLGAEVLNQAAQLLQKEAKLKAIIIPEISVGQNYWAKVRALERRCYLDEEVIEAARIFNKKAFLKVGGFDKNLIAAEDWDLSLRIRRLGKIGRIKAMIIHHEGKLSLRDHLAKKYYYSKSINLYTQKHPERFKTQTGVNRIRIFLKNWKKLATNPIHSAGVFILKFLEYLIYLLSKIG